MSTRRRHDLQLAGAIGLTVVAALATMSEVFLTGRWLPPAVIAVVASLAIVAAARLASLHWVTTLLASIGGWAVVVTALHVPEASLVPWIDEARALRELVTTGLVDLREEAAPVEPLPSLLVLLSSGAWFVTYLAHEVAVRLRGPGVALVPIAALWIVPLAVPQPGSPRTAAVVPFLLAAALVLLLEADADLVGWARDRATPRVTTAGATIATGAVVLGIVAPWLLPGQGEPPILDIGDGSNPRGYQPILDVGDRLSLPVERPVLQVRTDRRVYLRLAALDTYDDNYWRVGPAGAESFTPDEARLFGTDEPLPFETPIASPDTTVVDVEVLDLENIYAPTPYQPVEVTGPGASEIIWSQVGGFLATGELSQNEIGGELRTGVVPGFEYQVTAAVPDPSIEQLRAVEPTPQEVAPHLQLPGDPLQWQAYAGLAEQVYDERGATSTVDRVLALQDWFTDRGGFRYSVTDIDPLRGANALETFLFDTRVGYCEYFSTAMAVMLRASGIPARTAVGFLPGRLVEDGDQDADDPRDTYEISTGDAHAWVEVLFPGQGWITFDPTPRSDGATLPPDADDLSPELPLSERSDEEQAEGSDEEADDGSSIPEEDERTLLDRLGPAEPLPVGSQQDAGAPTWAVVLAVALLAAAAVLVARRSRDRHLEGAGRTVAAQRRVLRVGEQLGAGRHRSETAAEVLHRWAAEGRVDPTDAAELAVVAQRAAFSPSAGDADDPRAVRLADDLVDQLRRSAPRVVRLLAPVRLPATRGRDSLRRVVDHSRQRLTP